MSIRLGLYWKIFLVQIKNNWVREAVYRTNFLTAILVDLIWIVVELSLFSVIYSHTETLGGWTLHQVYFFLGIFFASDAIFSLLFMRNFWQFSDLVNRGDLDILLTKPVSPLFLALTRWMSLTTAFNILLGLGVAFRYADAAGFAGGWHWLEVPLWLMVGVSAQMLIRFLFSIWIFWTERGWALSRLYYSFYYFATKPDAIYPPWIRTLILTFLPFGMIGSLPARALVHGLTPKEWIYTSLSLGTFFWINRSLWRSGLKRYQSASS